MQKTKSTSDEKSILSDRIFVKDKDKLVKIYLADILYLEAARNYCKVVTTYQEYLISLPMKTVEKRISCSLFFRVHRSFIVNLSKVDEVLYENYILIGTNEIPISRSHYTAFLKAIRFI